MGARAVCVSQDPEVRRVVAHALAATGVTVHELPALADAPIGDDVALVIVDRATRLGERERLAALSVPVVVVGDSLDDDGLVSLMLEAPVSHLVADPRDRDLEITSSKLATGDLFGLEKYLAVGAGVHERMIASDGERRAAIEELRAWAESVGTRAPIVHRIGSVVDELLMNALLDAPRAGEPPRPPRPARLRWGHDDSAIAISVGDEFGTLSQRDIIDHVRRARGDRGRPRAATARSPGAGLGMYLVLANVASLVVNVARGQRTEVVCLFDRSRRAQRAVVGNARALHVFSRV